MLTRMLFETPFVSRMLTGGVMAFAVLATPIGLVPARADGAAAVSCVGTRGAIACAANWGPRVDAHIRRYLPPRDEQLEREAAQRERRWVARCRPVLKEDRYGVSRYEYAAPGCEFGRTHD